MTDKLDNKTTPVTPPVYATAAVPTVKVAAKDTELVEKFVKSSKTESDFEVVQKPQEGMDLFTWYMLARSESNVEGQDKDSSFTDGFKSLVRVLGLENEKITLNGETITMGELANRMTSGDLKSDGSGYDYPAGILGQARLPFNSPISAHALANAEKLADQKGVLGAIQTASRLVGVDESYMLLKAKQESGFNPNAHAKTSSAGGLYQFLDSTWVATTHKHKDLLQKTLGIDVDDLSRSQLLSLKNNAMASAVMGAAFAKDNKDYLERHVDVPGFKVNSAALYMAHFMGPKGAEDFFEKLARNPNASAAAAFPAAANSNGSVFAGKTLADLGEWAAGKMGMTRQPA